MNSINFRLSTLAMKGISLLVGWQYTDRTLYVGRQIGMKT